MGKTIDITNQRFGKWVAVEQKGNRKSGTALWWCVCDCGVEKLVGGRELRSGESKSCGCFQKRDPKRAALTSLFSLTRTTAKRRSIYWSLTEKQFEDLVTDDCFYCGTSPKPLSKSYYRSSSGLKVNGIDRIDSRDGYVLDNTVPCCQSCNFAKAQMSTSEFIEWIKRVYNHFIALTN